MAATSDCLDQSLRSVQLGIKSNFRVPFPTTSNLCKHCLRKCLEDVRRQGVNNADTQTEALGGPWPGDLRAGGTRTRGATGRARGTNSTKPWRLPPHGVVGMPSPV